MDELPFAAASYKRCYLMSFSVHGVVVVYKEVGEEQSGVEAGNDGRSAGLLVHV